ncbi:GGDEF domain-containing protein [Rhodopseudomonas sp. B29]|uniref:GGDEF domain-containing protein n=1 Tax=Rhodopseudomonas sp. B29 TaxID=95607 RepID=UPI0006878AFC|nr:GGDEF domain-containing protein [Rhodopseudomonas sp. B29]
MTDTQMPIDGTPVQPAIVAPRLIKWLVSGPTPQPDAILRRLVLHSQAKPRTLLMANISTTLMTMIAAALTGAAWAYVWVVLEVSLGMFRREAAHQMVRVETSGQPVNALSLYLGLVWATVYSAGCVLCVMAGQWPLCVLAAVVIAGLSSAISSRNAGMPRYGLAMICILAAPYTVAMMFSPLPQTYLVALLIPAWGVGMTILQFENYHVLLNLFLSEQTNSWLANYDRLTGLPNRTMQHRCFDELLNARRETGRETEPFTVLCLDLDGFKAANDRYGHAVGDAVLVEVAARLRRAVRTVDMIFRVGGDEFIIVLPDTSPRVAGAVADAVIAGIAVPFQLGQDQPISIGVSIGCAGFPQDGRSADDLLRAADHAMYEAKRRGKGTTVQAGWTEDAPGLVPEVPLRASSCQLDAVGQA